MLQNVLSLFSIKKHLIRLMTKLVSAFHNGIPHYNNRSVLGSMVGDTNLFFANEADRVVAEAEIMIAEPWARGKKLGWNAMILMLLYGIMELNVKQYLVKIGLDNNVSIKMFANMGFVETSVSQVFQEITMNKIVDDMWISWLNQSAKAFDIIKDS